jgi:hypothetical protein
MPTWVDGGDPVVTGTDAMTTPGGYQFAVAGGNGPYTWSISGTGASIDQTGYVSLSGACGSFFVTCTDCTGRSAVHGGTRITNSGTWILIGSCGIGGSSTITPFYCTAVEGTSCNPDAFDCRTGPIIFYRRGSGYTVDRYSGCYMNRLTFQERQTSNWFVGYYPVYCDYCSGKACCYLSIAAASQAAYLAAIDGLCESLEGHIPSELGTVFYNDGKDLHQAISTGQGVYRWSCA